VEIPTAPTGGDAGRPDGNDGGRGSAAPATRAALAPREVADAQATPPPPSSPLPHAAGRFAAGTDAQAALAAVSRRPPPLRPHTAGGPPLLRPAFPVIADRAPAAAIDVCTGRRRSGQSASGSRGGPPHRSPLIIVAPRRPLRPRRRPATAPGLRVAAAGARRRDSRRRRSRQRRVTVSHRERPRGIVAAATSRIDASAPEVAGGGGGGIGAAVEDGCSGGGGRGGSKADDGGAAAAQGGADTVAASDEPCPHAVPNAPSPAPADGRLPAGALRKDWDGCEAAATANHHAAKGAVAAGADGPAAASLLPSKSSLATCSPSRVTTRCSPPTWRFWPTAMARGRPGWGGPSTCPCCCRGAAPTRWCGRLRLRGGGADPRLGLRPADASGRRGGRWGRSGRHCDRGAAAVLRDRHVI